LAERLKAAIKRIFSLGPFVLRFLVIRGLFVFPRTVAFTSERILSLDIFETNSITSHNWGNVTSQIQAAEIVVLAESFQQPVTLFSRALSFP
jgi:hypothetical protein